MVLTLDKMRELQTEYQQLLKTDYPYWLFSNKLDDLMLKVKRLKVDK